MRPKFAVYSAKFQTQPKTQYLISGLTLLHTYPIQTKQTQFKTRVQLTSYHTQKGAYNDPKPDSKTDTIKTSVYRKATNTDKYLQFNSHHPSQHKCSVARTLLDRAKNIPSTDADKLSEVQHVVEALKINGYTDQFIRSCQSTIVSTNQPQTNRGLVTLPYIQGISEKIARTLNQFNVNVAHKPVMTVGSILRKPKDKFSKDLSSGVIYKINCKDRDKVYIGQTSRALRSRTREHTRTIFKGDENSLLAQHCIKNSHEFDLDDVKIIDRCSQWSKRLFLEAWHSIREPNPIHEHIYIPDIYKALGNPK